MTFVDGTTFGTDDTRLTMLSGEDLMDRTPMKPTCKADGQTLKIDFGETAPAGGFFRVEVYGVTFPVEGGDEPLAAPTLWPMVRPRRSPRFRRWRSRA